MNKKNLLYNILRIVLGVIITASGVAVLLMGGPPMEYPSESANNFMNAFVNSGYFMQFVSIVKILCGVSFLTNRFVPVASIIFMPVSVNMALFHIFLEFSSGVAAYAILAINTFLLFKNIESYRPMLKIKPQM